MPRGNGGAERSAVGGGAGIVGLGFGSRGEIAAGQNLLADVLRLGQRLCFGEVFLVGLERHARSFESDQNVAGFGELELGFVLVVIGVQGRVVDFQIGRDLPAQRVGQQLIGLDQEHLLHHRRLIHFALARFLREAHDLAQLVRHLALGLRSGSSAAVIR